MYGWLFLFITIQIDNQTPLAKPLTFKPCQTAQFSSLQNNTKNHHSLHANEFVNSALSAVMPEAFWDHVNVHALNEKNKKKEKKHRGLLVDLHVTRRARARQKKVN